MSSVRHLPDDASDSQIREIVFSDQSDVKDRFQRVFHAEIEAAVCSLGNAYRGYRELEATTQPDKRAAFVHAYSYSALNSLITSINVFLGAMLLPAGNLMRHYGEASAMALLCSHPKTGVFERLETDPGRFPYHKALELVNRTRNRELLGVKGQAWTSFMKLTGFYDRFSHASLFAVAANTMFEHPGLSAVVGEYDAEKEPSYRIELQRRRTAANVLTSLLAHLKTRLPSR